MKLYVIHYVDNRPATAGTRSQYRTPAKSEQDALADFRRHYAPAWDFPIRYVSTR